MHLGTVVFVGVIGLGLAIVPANATPVLAQKASPQVSNIAEVVGGCGPRFEANQLGQCIPIRGQHDWDTRYERAVRGR